MFLVDFKIVFLAETLLLLIILYFGRHFLKKRILELFSRTKIPPFYLQGFRFLLGLLLMERLYGSYYYESTLFIRPTSFFRIDTIFDLFFYSDYRFIILIVIPLIFVALFVFEWKPRLTSTVVFLYSVIGGTIGATLSLGKIPHVFHMTALMLLGFLFYYWFYYSSWHKVNRSSEWMIVPILLFFIGTIYGSSFMSKMSYVSEAPKWFTGQAVQSAIVEGHYQRLLTVNQDRDIGILSPIPQFVLNHKPLAYLLGIGTLLIEFSSLLLLVVSSRLRLLILISLMIFNVGTAILILAHFHFVRNILVLVYIIIWASYNAFPGRILQKDSHD